MLLRHSDLSYKQTAEKMGITEGTVKQYLYRARDKARSISAMAVTSRPASQK